jgi:hypothetical protein
VAAPRGCISSRKRRGMRFSGGGSAASARLLRKRAFLPLSTFTFQNLTPSCCSTCRTSASCASRSILGRSAEYRYHSGDGYLPCRPPGSQGVLPRM